MSDEKTSNLEPIESDDKSLAKKFGHIEKENFSKEAKQKEKTPTAGEKEPVNEIIVAEKDSSYNKILSKIKSNSSDDKKSSIIADAKSVSLKTDADGQVNHLVDLAMNNDVGYAVKVAKHLEDNYILDMFHDKLLSDELHDALSEKGLI